MAVAITGTGSSTAAGGAEGRGRKRQELRPGLKPDLQAVRPGTAEVVGWLRDAAPARSLKTELEVFPQVSLCPCQGQSFGQQQKRGFY